MAGVLADMMSQGGIGINHKSGRAHHVGNRAVSALPSRRKKYFQIVQVVIESDAITKNQTHYRDIWYGDEPWYGEEYDKWEPKYLI